MLLAIVSFKYWLMVNHVRRDSVRAKHLFDWIFTPGKGPTVAAGAALRLHRSLIAVDGKGLKDGTGWTEDGTLTRKPEVGGCSSHTVGLYHSLIPLLLILGNIPATGSSCQRTGACPTSG